MSDHADDSRVHIEGLKPAHVAMLKAVAAEAAEQAVNKTLAVMGLNPSLPFESQADMKFLRSTRERCEKGGWQATIILIGLLVAGAATAFWAGFKSLLTGPH